jgi:hypothetical protein
LQSRQVGVELDAVPFRIGEVDRFADPVVRRALEGVIRREEPPERARQVLPGGIADRLLFG